MSNVTGSTTPRTGIIKHAFNILYFMLIALSEPELWLHKPVNQTDVEFSSRTFSLTFALICVFIQDCFCRYNFSIPKKIKREKEYFRYKDTEIYLFILL